jgi:hypothetical protein
MIVVGIDPGGKHSGIVLRDRDQLLGCSTIHWGTNGRHDYHEAIVDKISLYAAQADLVAVEDIVAPTGFSRGRDGHIIQPGGLLETAVVVGIVLGRWPQTIVVAPHGNGSGPPAGYPEKLRPTRGQGKGFDALRHVRSAWDVAGAALTTMRLRQAAGG